MCVQQNQIDFLITILVQLVRVSVCVGYPDVGINTIDISIHKNGQCRGDTNSEKNRN